MIDSGSSNDRGGFFYILLFGRLFVVFSSFLLIVSLPGEDRLSDGFQDDREASPLITPCAFISYHHRVTVVIKHRCSMNETDLMILSKQGGVCPGARMSPDLLLKEVFLFSFTSCQPPLCDLSSGLGFHGNHFQPIHLCVTY